MNETRKRIEYVPLKMLIFFVTVNVPMLLVTYGVVAGFGLGLIFLPAVVCVGHYFESKAGHGHSAIALEVIHH